MTLADFIRVFDFNRSKVEIFTYSNSETYAGTYFSENEIERDFFTTLYNVMEIRTIGEFTLQIVIFH